MVSKEITAHSHFTPRDDMPIALLVELIDTVNILCVWFSFYFLKETVRFYFEQIVGL